MATPTPVLAVLDADVLHPPGLRDLLLTVAEQGLYRPVWTARILTEMSESIREAAARRSLVEPDTARVEAEMRTAFPAPGEGLLPFAGVEGSENPRT